MLKVNCFLKIRFNKNELTLRAEKIKTLHMIENGPKRSIRICFQLRIFTLSLHTEMVKESKLNK